ncbi:hypothetical protein [Streptomyces lunaelactis]|uniref:hypothetical protein n=1 Tax=Streptomyces lunaelactis TaxID=1535768 RepID=UPI0015850328|nr:hypothetical protein [Streptomyces lunaelactis]NUK20529.1 hypothetical protein [Streptomyces lunaelactis]
MLQRQPPAVHLTVVADGVTQAAAIGIEYVQAAAARHRITADTVIGTEVSRAYRVH